MNRSEYGIVNARFRSLFSELSSCLSTDGRENVDHYLGVDELDMACESLVLSVLEEGVGLSPLMKRELMSCCLSLGLDKESVFRHDFWMVAEPFLIEWQQG